MHKSLRFTERLGEGIDLFYRLVKISGLFWLSLLKSFIITGIFSSFYALFASTDEILQGNGRPVRNLFKEQKPPFKHSRIISLLAASAGIYTAAFVILPFPAFIPDQTGLVIKYGFLYIQILLVLFFTYFCWHAVKTGAGLKQCLTAAFYFMIRHFIRTVSLAVLLALLIYISHSNWVFFFFCTPALYAAAGAWLLKGLYTKTERKEASE